MNKKNLEQMLYKTDTVDQSNNDGAVRSKTNKYELTHTTLFNRIRKGFAKYIVAGLALATIGIGSCESDGNINYGNQNSAQDTIQDIMPDNYNLDIEPEIEEEVFKTITCLGDKDGDGFGMKYDQLLVSGFNPKCL